MPETEPTMSADQQIVLPVALTGFTGADIVISNAGINGTQPIREIDSTGGSQL